MFLQLLKELSFEEQKELETALIKPMLMVSAIDSMDPHSLEYKEKFGHIPEGIDIYQAISMMDQNTKDQMTQQIDSQIEAMGESTMLIAAGNGEKRIKQGKNICWRICSLIANRNSCPVLISMLVGFYLPHRVVLHRLQLVISVRIHWLRVYDIVVSAHVPDPGKCGGLHNGRQRGISGCFNGDIPCRSRPDRVPGGKEGFNLVL